jgi:hypothetical protein
MDAPTAPAAQTTYWERTTTWTVQDPTEHWGRGPASRNWYDYGELSTMELEAKQTVVWKEISTFPARHTAPCPPAEARGEANWGSGLNSRLPEQIAPQRESSRTPPGFVSREPPGLERPMATSGGPAVNRLGTYDDGLSRALAQVLRYNTPSMDMEGFTTISATQAALKRTFSIDDIREVVRLSLNRNHLPRFQLDSTGLKIKANTDSTRTHRRHRH